MPSNYYSLLYFVLLFAIKVYSTNVTIVSTGVVRMENMENLVFIYLFFCFSFGFVRV